MTFNERYHGSFSGLIRKDLFDDLLKNIDAQQVWYEIQIHKNTHTLTVVSENAVKERISEVAEAIEAKGHHTRYDWFYADSLDAPHMIKVYNPLLCGCAGGDSTPPLRSAAALCPCDSLR